MQARIRPASRHLLASFIVISVVLAPVAALAAQGPETSRTAQALTEVIDGPPAPTLPAIVSRDEKGNVTLRAVRISEPITVDGRLDDPSYNATAAASDFVQQDPEEGAPATDKTEVWVFYDEVNIYIGARLWEREPGRRVTSDMRRDSPNLYNNDHLAVLLDTFYDRRNGFGFMANAQGGLFDWAITNEQPNNNWNQIWFSESAEFDGGWSVEFQIPFRSLRTREDGTLWGINFRRMVRWKNELSYLNPVPRSWGRRGLSKVSSAATLVGLTRPGKTLNLDVKPYLLASTVTNRRVTPAIENDGGAEWGIDTKWAITQSLIADFTYNTDFAQVEDDEQQVNLTRFSLFFPERREFFLEGQDVFSFGGTGGGGGGGGFGGGGGGAGPGGGGSGGAGGLNNQNTPVLFFSRRIGLEAGEVVPIEYGARVLGRRGGFNVGALNMGTDAAHLQGSTATNFSVVRVTRDVFARSRIGVIGTARSPRGPAAAGYTTGADGIFNLYENVTLTTYYARTNNPGASGDESSYRGAYSWNGDRWGLQGDYLHVGDHFNPQIGFLRRQAFDRSFGQFRFSPRPMQPSVVRRHTFETNLEYITGAGRALESREAQGTYRVEFHNGDQWSAEVTRSHEALSADFPVGGELMIPVGHYSFMQFRTNYNFGNQRRLNGSLTLAGGGFYDGTLKELTWRGRLEPSPVFLIEPTVSWNRIETPHGDFTTTLGIARVTWTMSPRRFVAALVQYQSASNSVTTNARFRWEYAAGSELFIVYSDSRNTLSRGFPSTDTRSFVVKLTRLFRW